MPLDLTSFTPSTTIASSQMNSNFSDIQTIVNNMRPMIGVSVRGTLTTETGIATPIELSQDYTGVEVILRVGTAPDGAAIIVDINKNGTTIFNTRPQINDGATSGGGSAVFSSTSFSDGDVLTFDIDQVGSTSGGDDLTVQLVFRY